MTTPDPTQQEKCKACRECCEYVEFPVTMLSVDVMEYFQFRGNRFYIDKGGALMVRIKDPCQHLTPEGCGIYATRPFTCRNYMCSQKDESVKTAKEKQCDYFAEHIKKATDRYRAKPNKPKNE